MRRLQVVVVAVGAVGEDEEVHVVAAAAEEEDGGEVSRCGLWMSKGVICIAALLDCLLGRQHKSMGTLQAWNMWANLAVSSTMNIIHYCHSMPPPEPMPTTTIVTTYSASSGALGALSLTWIPPRFSS